jgi:hypothetical protein
MGVTIQKQSVRSVYFNAAYWTSYFAAAYNNNLFKWNTDTIKTIATGEIWFNGTLKFTKLVPGSAGPQFNVEEVIKSLFGNFNDTVAYILSDVVIFDANLCNVTTIKLKLIYTDTTTDEIDVTGYYLKAVRQHHDQFASSMYYFESDFIFGSPVGGLETCRALMPTGINKTGFTQKLRIFKGYPQDLSVIAKTVNNNLQFTLFTPSGTYIGFENKTITAGSRTNKYVQRIILSDGQNIVPIFNTFPQTKGKLQIASMFDDGTAPNSIYNFLYELVDDCGVYIKWLNSCGGYSYWLFNKDTKTTFNAKSKGTISTNDGELSFASDENNIGTEATEKIQVTTQNLDSDYLKYVSDIATSPAVYLYMKPKDTLAYANGNIDVWLKLPQIVGFQYPKKSSANIYAVSFEFILPKIFTQTL